MEGTTTKKPFFSVIIPAHNSGNWIRVGLNSIKKQTFTDYELIVVCDACTDGTADIVREYADKTLIRDYHLDGLARNAGIDAAEGEYVLFMDDDDWFWDETVFQKIHDAIVVSHPDVLMFGFYWKERGLRFQEAGNRVIACWAKCWKRTAIGGTRFSDKPYWSDVDFDNRMFAKDLKIVSLNECLYYYNYLRPGSISWRQQKGEIQ